MGKKNKSDARAPIDHARVVDGFGELIGRRHYESFETPCGRCGVAFVFTASAQKYVHEERGVPIKRARSGVGYCSACVVTVGQKKKVKSSGERLRSIAQAAKAIADADPKSGAKLLEYVVAKIRVLERSWSPRAAERLLGDVRRARRLAPQLSGVNKWEARLAELIAAHRG